MTVRFYSSIAQQTTLTGTYSPSSTVIAVAGTTGFPSSTPFTLSLDYGAPNEELVDVTSVAGLSLTVTRAVDGTSATTHNAGAVVRHVSSARDFAESRAHENASTNVHGIQVGSSVVGTTDTQTLTNKTLTNPTFNNPTITGTVAGGATYASPTLSNPTSTGTDTVTGNEVINNSAAATIPLVVRGATSQSANLQEWRNVGGTNLASVNSAGKLFAPNGINSTAATASVAPLLIKGAASQTADYMDIQNSAGASLVRTDNSGRFIAQAGATIIGDLSPSTGGVELQAGASSINIAEFKDSGGVLQASVGASTTAGIFYGNGFKVQTDNALTAGGGVGFRHVVIAGSSQTVTSSTTLVDNTVGLTFDVLSGGVYRIELRCFFSGSTAGDVKVAWRQSGADSDLVRMVSAPGATTANIQDGTYQGVVRGAGSNVAAGIDTSPGIAYKEDMMHAATANSTWILQFAQNTSSVTGTVLNTGSYLLVTKVQ